MTELNDRQYTFIQKIAVVQADGKKLDVLPDSVISCHIIENANMNGTQLILKLNDPSGQYRDNYNIKYLTELEITYGDVLNTERSEMAIDSFIVMLPTSENNQMKIEGLQKTCHQLKQPASRPRFFTNKTPNQIISALVPGIKLDIDNLGPGTYHLNAGANTSRLIRNMARDYGCIAYYCRGTLYFKQISKLFNTTPLYTFESGNNKASLPIQRYTFIDEQYLYDRLLDRTFVQWDTENGMMYSSDSGDDRFGSVLVTTGTTTALDSQGKAIIPVMTLELFGLAQLVPGVLGNVVISVSQSEKVLDETHPEKQLLNKVVHYTKGCNYSCVIETGIPNV